VTLDWTFVRSKALGVFGLDREPAIFFLLLDWITYKIVKSPSRLCLLAKYFAKYE
jgi:hypothetical protein